jgi:eukaryotic-like serine/threonine-protein kinase
MEAIDLLGAGSKPDVDQIMALYARVGELCFRNRDLQGGAARMESALSLAEELGRERDIARFALWRGRLLIHANRFDEGRQRLAQAHDLARRLQAKDILCTVALARGEADIRTGEHKLAREHLSRAMEGARDTADARAQLRCLVPLAVGQASSGDIETATDTIQLARSVTSFQADPFSLCELHKAESLVHFFANDPLKAVEAATKALDLAQEHGFSYEVAINAHNIGEFLLLQGDYRRAFSSLRSSYDLAREHGFVRLQMVNMRTLGFIDAAKFGSDEGRMRMVQAAEYAANHHLTWDLLQGRYMLALVDQARGNIDDAATALQEVIALAIEHGHARIVQEAQQALAALPESESSTLAT